MIRAATLIALVLGLSACTSDSIDVQEQLSNSTGESDVDAGSSPDAASTDTDTTPEQSVGDTVAPAVRVPENEGDIEASNWLARTYMDAESVELVWSPVDGAEKYRLYRITTAEADYDRIAEGDLDGTERIYEGDDYGYIDTDAESNQFHTYVVVAEVDGARTQPRWTEALTVTDTTPPTPIADLRSTNTDEGVLLEWSPSSDDIEFAAYNVSILEDGLLRYIGGGADEQQTGFVDTEAFTGVRTYVVSAVDFHDNVSESAQLEVTK